MVVAAAAGCLGVTVAVPDLPLGEVEAAGIIRGERCDRRTRVTLDGDPLPWGLEVVAHSPPVGVFPQGDTQMDVAALIRVSFEPTLTRLNRERERRT